MRRRSRGQSLVIFALSFTALLGFAGLAVDALRAFDLYARMQRAAEAGALAAALYMPTYYNTVRPGDVDSAISRASKEVVKNGFGTVLSPTLAASSACPANLRSVEVAVCQISGKQDQLGVVITERLNLVLLGALGLGPTTLVASAQAEYLPPVQIGSRTSYFGDQFECSPGNGSQNTNAVACDPNDTSSQHLQYFEAALNGPADLKESGDPYVYCAEGPATTPSSSATPAFNGNGTDPGSTSNPQPFYAYNGYPSNHPQWSDINTNPNSTQKITNHCGLPGTSQTGNPDQQPAGYWSNMTANTAHPGGYTYQVVVTPGITGSLWIYNANYVPQDAYNPCGSPVTPPPLDRFVDICQYFTNYQYFYQGPAGEGIGNRFDGSHHDAPLFFYNVTYTLYNAPNIYDPSQGAQVAQATYQPFDDLTADLQRHGCTVGSQLYYPYWNGADTANTYHKSGSIVAGQGCYNISDLQAGTVTSIPNLHFCWNQWCLLANNLAPGTYRLEVEATGITDNAPNSSGGYDYQSTPQDGWGHHSYGLKVCDQPSPTITSPVGCGNGTGAYGAGQYNTSDVSVYGWNDMDVVFQASLSTRTPNKNYPSTSCVTSANNPYACMDLGCIPSQYAGRTLTLGLFDPGDGLGSGNDYIGVSPPAAGGTITYPSNITTTTIDGVTAVVAAQGSYRPFNGLWLKVTLTLPATYNGDCTNNPNKTSGWWQLMYATDKDSSGNPTFQPTDQLAVSFALTGSPVHLVPATLG